MRYLIENKVIYDSDSGEFIIISAGVTEKQRLTHTANQVLALLIASHGEVVERQRLLKEVWGVNGQPESSSSLNQYISILRRSLTVLIDIDNVIITSPRVGFFLSPEINIKPYDSDKKTSLMANKPSIKLLFIISLPVVLLIMIFILRVNLFPSLKETKRVLGNIEKCKVISYTRAPNNMNKMMIDIIKETHPGLQEKCKDTPAKLIIYIQEHIFYGKRGHVFSSFCPIEKESNRVVHCKSSYMNKWGYDD